VLEGRGLAGFFSGEDVFVFDVVSGKRQSVGDEAHLDRAARAGIAPEGVMEESAKKCVKKESAGECDVEKDCAEGRESYGLAGEISCELAFEVCRSFREESLHGADPQR